MTTLQRPRPIEYTTLRSRLLHQIIRREHERRLQAQEAAKTQPVRRDLVRIIELF